MNDAPIRALFPSLASHTAFLDNAGGSQIPGVVIEAITRYFHTSYAQLGGDYPQSRSAAQTIARGRAAIASFLNAPAPSNVVLGASTSQLCLMLAHCFGDALDAVRQNLPTAARSATLGLPARRQVIVSTAGHESNVGPWMRLAHRGFEVIPWPTEKCEDGQYRPRLETLKKLLSDRTLIVTVPQVSNILGEVWNVRAMADAAHAVGAKILVDGVAYAPHAAPDVQALDCDWYVYSTYKVFGPHMAAMFGKADAWGTLTGQNHFFIDPNEVPRKFETGGVCHEGCAGLAALLDFARGACAAAGGPVPSTDREALVSAFAALRERELRLQHSILTHLGSMPGIRLIGPGNGVGEHDRIGTVSFVSDWYEPKALASAANHDGIAIRWGHFYSRRLVEELGLNPERGVMRMSVLGYNTQAEVDRALLFIETFTGASEHGRSRGPGES